MMQARRLQNLATLLQSEYASSLAKILIFRQMKLKEKTSIPEIT